jgi:hypothetical protein
MSNETTGDAWTDALLAYLDGDPAPLNDYLRVAAEALPTFADQLCDLARLLQFMHAKTQTRPPGNPGGSYLLWQKPNYLAAWFAERWIAKHKHDTRRRTVTNARRETFIADAVNLINGWHFAKDDPASVDRVREILRGPRTRRLP